MNDVIKNVDVDAVSKNVEAGKVDFDSLFQVLSQLLSQKEIEQLVNNAKVLAKSKNGQPIVADDIADVLNGVVDTKKIQQRVEAGQVDVQALVDELPNLMGDEASEKLLNKTEQLANKMKKENKHS